MSETDVPKITEQTEDLDPRTCEFYLRSLARLDDSGIPYLLGGAYSLGHFASVVRHTKDLDIFVQAHDRDRVLELFARAGYRTQLTFPHWLAKVHHGDAYIDVIYASGNGLCRVDDEWFAHAVHGEALGRPARLCPPEEMIWTKSFIQERERYDGADIAHVILHQGRQLDWKRLLRRFTGHEAVLLGHLVFFQYIYPSERSAVPDSVIDELFARSRASPAADGQDRVCRGTFLSRMQYLDDIGKGGFSDARVRPRGPLSAEDVTYWTWAIDRIK